MVDVDGQRLSFSITSAMGHTGVWVSDISEQGYVKGEGEADGVGRWIWEMVEEEDWHTKLTVVVVFSFFQSHSFSLDLSRIHTSHSFGTPLLEPPLVSSNSGKNAV